MSDLVVSLCEKKSGCTCRSDVKEILTPPNYISFVSITSQLHFRYGPTCPSNIDFVNISGLNPEFTCPRHSDAYFFAHWWVSSSFAYWSGSNPATGSTLVLGLGIHSGAKLKGTPHGSGAKLKGQACLHHHCVLVC